MSRQLWGWVGAAVAAAALTVPGASAHAEPDHGYGPSANLDVRNSASAPAAPRGWYLTIGENGVHMRVNMGKQIGAEQTNMNTCHQRIGTTYCPHIVYNLGKGDPIFAHCQAAGEPIGPKGDKTWLFASYYAKKKNSNNEYFERTGYVSGHFVASKDLIKNVPACKF